MDFEFMNYASSTDTLAIRIGLWRDEPPVFKRRVDLAIDRSSLSAEDVINIYDIIMLEDEKYGSKQYKRKTENVETLLDPNVIFSLFSKCSPQQIDELFMRHAIAVRAGEGGKRYNNRCWNVLLQKLMDLGFSTVGHSTFLVKMISYDDLTINRYRNTHTFQTYYTNVFRNSIVPLVDAILSRGLYDPFSAPAGHESLFNRVLRLPAYLQTLLIPIIFKYADARVLFSVYNKLPSSERKKISILRRHPDISKRFCEMDEIYSIFSPLPADIITMIFSSY